MSEGRLAPDDPREWLNRAQSNLTQARARIPGVYLEDLCFAAQQAAEKAAKAGSADALLTTDDRMLAKAKELRGSLHVKVENPILWLMEVTENGVPKNDDSRPD